MDYTNVLMLQFFSSKGTLYTEGFTVNKWPCKWIDANPLRVTKNILHII